MAMILPHHGKSSLSVPAWVSGGFFFGLYSVPFPSLPPPRPRPISETTVIFKSGDSGDSWRSFPYCNYFLAQSISVLIAVIHLETWVKSFCIKMKSLMKRPGAHLLIYICIYNVNVNLFTLRFCNCAVPGVFLMQNNNRQTNKFSIFIISRI